MESISRRKFIITSLKFGASLTATLFLKGEGLKLDNSPYGEKVKNSPQKPDKSRGQKKEVVNYIPQKINEKTQDFGTFNHFLFKEVDFSKEGSEISISIPNLGISESKIEVLTLSEPITQENLEKKLEEFKPGNGTGLVCIDKDGNIILYLHSGYWQNRPLEAEGLRIFIEGYKDKTILDKKYISERLEGLIGQVVKISQIDRVNVGEEKVMQFKIIAAIQIPHELKENFSSINDAISPAMEFGIGNKENFGILRNKRGLIIVFCGWGPENASLDPNSEDYRFTYTYYILGLIPVD